MSDSGHSRRTRGKSKKIIPNIEKECKNQNIEFEIRYITKEKSGYDIAFEYKDKEYVIYVVGGDGTLTLVLPALVGTKNKLGIIPSGSGNDTYRTIKDLTYHITENGQEITFL